ncbi:MAG: hypothetical protein M1308_13670 [Actinobacteria bacterium]|nr:hypothetical protein [Actinomycetota bacterium]
MNTRELFLRILNFQDAPRTLDWEFGYWGGTIKRWYQEGLPMKYGLTKEVTYGEAVAGTSGHWPVTSWDENLIRDLDVSDFFNFDSGIELIPFHYWIYPKYEPQILKEDDQHRELIDKDGIKKRIYKNDSSMPQFLDWPVKNKKDWEIVREERFRYNFEERLKGDIQELKIKYSNRQFPLGLFCGPVGFFGSLRFLMGDVNLFFAYYDQPALLKEIINFLVDFWLDLSSEIMKHFEVDVVFFWEDMSGKNGSLISPSLFREFMMPPYKKIISALKSRGMNHFMVDTDGNVAELIPLFLECGMTGMYPFEVQAGNDIFKIRKKYPKLQIMGGLDKNTLSKDRENIVRELNNLEELIQFGGYIPFADHFIPPNVSWENFKIYRKELKSKITGTPILVNK